VTWQKKKIPLSLSISNAKLYDSLNGMIVAVYRDSARLYSTTNGGGSWDEFILPDTLFFPPTLGIVSLWNKDLIGFVSRSMYLYTSTNRGQSWNKIHLDNSIFRRLGDVVLLEYNNMFVGGGTGLWDGFLFQSTDGGTTWTSRVTQSEFMFCTSKFLTKSTGQFWLEFGDSPQYDYTWLCNFGQSEKIVIINGWVNGVLYDDGSVMILPLGAKFTKKNQTNDSLYVFSNSGEVRSEALFSTSKWNTWVLADSSRLFRRVDPLTGIHEKEQDDHDASSVAREVTLSVYPNPFNPSTTVRYSLPHDAFITLQLFDVLSRKICILASGKENEGVHIIKFDGSTLGSGIYFLRLQSQTFIESRKLLLLR
jgi:hypothetical protein